MNSLLLMYEQGINDIVAKINGGSYSHSDLSNLRIYIEGYNRHVRWLANKHNPEVYSEIKSEDFGVFYEKDAVYIEFPKQ